MAQATHLYAIALGSNRRHGRYGRPLGVVEAAIARLEGDFGLFDAAPVMGSKAMGGPGRDFANSVAIVESDLDPYAMLWHLKMIEEQFGRRVGRRWGDRVLDLDIVAWDGPDMRTRELTIPHPELAKRDFVLQPLAAIAPDWRVHGAKSVKHLLHCLGKRRALR